jgi:cytidyltransferase-like protein
MKPLVLAHGCFDIFHIGHLLHLQAAAEIGTLVVSITRDEHIHKPGMPVFTTAQRAAVIGALRCVHEVYICQTQTALGALAFYSPDVFIKGPDYKRDTLNHEELAFCDQRGIKIMFTDTPKFSSSELKGKLK